MKNVSLRKNVILNLIKQILSIAFPLITFPYVSRILLEENYGKYSFGVSIANYITILAALGIQSYAVREGARIRNNRDELNRFVSELYTFNIITTVFAYGILFTGLICWPKLHDYRMLLLVQCSSILFTTLGANWVNSIFEDYAYMTKRYILVKVICLFLIFSFVKERKDYVLYAAIIAASDILANIANIIYNKRYVRLRIVFPCRFFSHLKPILTLFASMFAITIYSNMGITVLGIYTTDAVVGIYSFVNKIYQIAKNLLNAVIVVLIPRLSVYLGNNDYQKYTSLLQKSVGFIITLAMPMIMGIIMLSEEIILFIGGANYVAGNVVLKLLGVGLVFASLGSVCLDCILVVNRRERHCVTSILCGTCVNLVLNVLLIPIMGMVGAAFAIICSEIVSCSMAFWYSKDICANFNILKSDMISVGVGTVLVGVCCGIVRSVMHATLEILVTSVMASCLIYGVVMVIMRNTICEVAGIGRIQRILKRK